MAGTVTVSRIESPNLKYSNPDRQIVKIAWTSDASGDATLAIPLTGLLMRVITVPSASDAPTDNYDISFLSDFGTTLDVMESMLANRDTTNAEAINFGGVDSLTNGSPIFLLGNYTFTVAAAGNAKSGTVYLYIAD